MTDEFQYLTQEQIEAVGKDHSREIKFVETVDKQEDYRDRTPVVAIMGHVDHGKTTVLDALRHSHVVEEEFGDITQQIGAYTFQTDFDKQEFTFIDTPGHENFLNLRLRGAQLTDVILLVVSATDGIQPQTIEVIELSKRFRIPIIVAINKIDKINNYGEVDEIIIELSQHGIVSYELGGDVPIVRISALKQTNLKLLENEIASVIKQKCDLLTDFSGPAQCYVIDSRFDEATQQILASVLVKQGILRLDDLVVCGIEQSRVRIMHNDHGENMASAFPGETVTIGGGFKHIPEIGHPLFSVETHDEAKFLTKQTAHRREKQKAMIPDFLSLEAHELQKKVHGLTPIERRKIYGGDKTIMYEKLGLTEEIDLERYRKKVGMSNDHDLLSMDRDHIDLFIEEQKHHKKKLTPLQRAKKEFETQEFKKLFSSLHDEQLKLQEMTIDERRQYLQEKNKLKEILREEEVKHYPMIIKASTAGSLETLLSQVGKLLNETERVDIIDCGIGPVTEGDMAHALQTGAVIFAFDVECQEKVNKLAFAEGCCIKVHKLIHTMIKDVDSYIKDAQFNIAIQQENIHHNHPHQHQCIKEVEVIGSGTITDLYKITETNGSHHHHHKGIIDVVGIRVTHGKLERKYKYRVIRNLNQYMQIKKFLYIVFMNGEILQDGLVLHSMKKLHDNVTTVDKGLECGVCFQNYTKGDLKSGDLIECYKDHTEEKKFEWHPGVHFED